MGFFGDIFGGLFGAAGQGGPGLAFGPTGVLGELGKITAEAGAAKQDADIRSEAQKQIDLQKEFAQHGIRWRVEDAKAAGIHPLAALGASTASYSPVQVGGGYQDSSGYLPDMGQNIARAIDAMTSKDEKADKLLDLQLERAELENAALRSDIALKQVNGPGLPSRSGLPGSLTGAGQGDAYVFEKPLERVHSAAGKPHQEVGKITSSGWQQIDNLGSLAPVPSKDVKERIEDNLLQETAWAMRNQLAPNFGLTDAPSKELLPPGYDTWRWSYSKQAYTPARTRKRYRFESQRRMERGY